MTIWVVIIIAIALAFDFFNGFHDAANSIATVVSTRVLSPQQAVAWAAFFNFVGVPDLRHEGGGDDRERRGGPGVLDNARDLRRPDRCDRMGHDHLVARPADVAPRTPSIGGHGRGGASRTPGWAALIACGLQKIAVFIVLSPMVGLLLGFTFMVAVYWVFHRDDAGRAQPRVPAGQLFSAAAFSLATARTTRRRRWASSWRC